MTTQVKEHPDYVTVSTSLGVHFAILMRWQDGTDLYNGRYDVAETSVGYDTYEKAEEDAKFLAELLAVEYKPQSQGIVITETVDNIRIENCQISSNQSFSEGKPLHLGRLTLIWQSWASSRRLHAYKCPTGYRLQLGRLLIAWF